MSTGAWVLIAAVVLAVALGSWRAYADGRFRVHGRSGGARDLVEGREASASSASRAHPDLAALGLALGERATLLQFSSAFCAPCRATRRVLAEVAGTVPGVVHHELDAEQHLDLVRRLGVLRTPTTLILDGTGAEQVRAAGAPTKSQVLAQLGTVL